VQINASIEMENPMRTKRVKFLLVFSIVCFLIIACTGKESPAPPPASLLKILISNDDGVDAPGIAALFEKLAPLGRVTVAAPNRNYSGAGHSMPSNLPIMVEEMEKNGSKWYAIDGTPVTCVRLALESLLTEKPDIVVSGINRGENIGLVTFYSGTTACAREASIKGIPSIAVSLQNSPVMDYKEAAGFVAELVRGLRTSGFKPGLFLNVNYPALPKDKIKGTIITRQDLQCPIQTFEKRVSPRGKVYFWSLYRELSQAPEKTDVWALANGYISITPLQIDQTNSREMEDLKSLKIKGLKN
jgi:5'-nucleotidase